MKEEEQDREENRLINICGRRRTKRKNTSNSRRGKPWCGVKGSRASKIALKWSALLKGSHSAHVLKTQLKF